MSAASESQAVVQRQRKYAEQQNVSGIFESLTTALVYSRPDTVVSFLVEELDRMQTDANYTPIKVSAFTTMLLIVAVCSIDLLQAGDAVQTEEQAADYLTKHNVQSLMEDLLSRVLVARPEKPVAFLRQVVSDIASNGRHAYFTDSDIRGMHSLHDPTGNNYITHSQAATALRNLGVSADVVKTVSWSNEHVTGDEFVAVAQQLLDSAAR